MNKLDKDTLRSLVYRASWKVTRMNLSLKDSVREVLEEDFEKSGIEWSYNQGNKVLSNLRSYLKETGRLPKD